MVGVDGVPCVIGASGLFTSVSGGGVAPLALTVGVVAVLERWRRRRRLVVFCKSAYSKGGRSSGAISSIIGGICSVTGATGSCAGIIGVEGVGVVVAAAGCSFSRCPWRRRRSGSPLVDAWVSVPFTSGVVEVSCACAICVGGTTAGASAMGNTSGFSTLAAACWFVCPLCVACPLCTLVLTVCPLRATGSLLSLLSSLRLGRGVEDMEVGGTMALPVADAPPPLVVAGRSKR